MKLTPRVAAEILTQFLESDRSLRRWKRRRANGAPQRNVENLHLPPTATACSALVPR